MSDLPRPEYPRPNLVRNDWLNLNGLWRIASDPNHLGIKERWYDAGLPGESTVTVPFAPGSDASGVALPNADDWLWYERTFEVPDDWRSERIVLNFGAVDFQADVFVNGVPVGSHKGGYTPFSFDIQHLLVSGQNRLTVKVEDSLAWTQPRGKQAGTTRWPIDYDAVTGIWQPVWLEPLPQVSVESVYPVYKLSDGILTCLIGFSQQTVGKLTVELCQEGKACATGSVDIDHRAEGRVQLKVQDAKLWSPDSPYLYQLNIHVESASDSKDTVSSYCGLREVSVRDGELTLNGEPLYLRGVLDQGYFPGGWYTPLDDADFKKDIELTLSMGFNCARKHQKAEDPRYLYWADKLGLLVWAEMPSGRVFSTELVQSLTTEWSELIVRDRGHPSVITWVPFNESWGVWNQVDRPEQRSFVEGIVGLTHSLDSSRPVVGNDGWEFSAGDLWTLHIYQEGENLNEVLEGLIANPQAAINPEESDVGRRIGALPGSSVDGLPIILSECGGIGFGRYGDDDFSYGDMPLSEAELLERIREVMATIYSADSLRGFVWTQLTDVQQEINGLLYFDRSPKVPLDALANIFRGK